MLHKSSIAILDTSLKFMQHFIAALFIGLGIWYTGYNYQEKHLACYGRGRNRQMQFHAITLNSVPEASYLTAENAWRYRAIMRTFYLESQKAHIRLNKTELLALLRADSHFSDYTAEQLEQDLNALCGWRNLVPIQDPHRPTSIAEYKNKQFSYSMSQTATEIERMTLSLESLNLRTAILSAQLFERILDTLERMAGQDGTDSRGLNQLWDQLQQDFRQLTNRYQDYLRDFYSSHARHILQTTEFLPYKDKVMRYLQEFVLELQRYAKKIHRMLLTLPPQQIEGMLQQVYKTQLQEGEGRLIQRAEGYPEQLWADICDFWQRFYHWFVPGEDGQSDSQHVLDLANDIIQRILMNVELILQAHSGGANRKVEYKKFLELFAACPTLGDAHRLSGMVFGAQRAVHLTGIGPEDLYETGSCYDAQPFLYQLRNRRRPGRPPREKSFFEDKSLEKAAQKQIYLQKKAALQARLERLIRKGRLDFSTLEEVVTPEIRTSLLNWVVKANANASKSARTEFGQPYRLICSPGRTCVLHCTDGDLTMPAYCLEFEEAPVHG